MWCVPHPSKPDYILALLDPEGLGDVEKVIREPQIYPFQSVLSPYFFMIFGDLSAVIYL